MILTYKTKEDFLKWYSHNPTNLEEVEFDFNMENELLKTAYIIEFFDSVGIYILLRRFTHLFEFNDWYFIVTNKEGVYLNNYLEDRIKTDSRQQATEQAIIKANEIYNERNKI